MEAFVRLAGYIIVGGIVWLLMTKVSPWFLVLGAVLQVIVSIIDMRTNEFESPWFERAAKGLCTNCGYDLRSSIIRCPECGQSMEK
jgi:hypothetical protein